MIELKKNKIAMEVSLVISTKIFFIGKINDEQELNTNIKELISILETDKSIASTFSLIGTMATFGSIPFVWKSAVYLISIFLLYL
jgi:hypothetical protein